MDRSEIEAAEVAPRYLAGQLSQDEATVFEEAYARDPEIVADLERTLRLKEGLAILRERGELTALLRVAPRRQWFVRVAAAAVIAIAVGAAFWQRTSLRDMVWPAPALRADNRQSAPVLGSYVLIRTRESSAALDVPLQPRAGVIELRILPAAFIPHGRYAARLVRREVSSDQMIGEIESVTPGHDHFVTIYVDKGRLARGDYSVFLAPASAGPAAEEADQFTLRVR
jgi:hypothetical protein